MSTLQTPAPAKLYLSLLYQGDPGPGLPPVADEALSALEAVFGATDLRSPPLAFGFTDYYEEEMGSGLWRLAVSFAQLTPPERLVEIKHFTAALERRLAGQDGRRRVNLDPGLITAGHLVLATGKSSPHRIYLGRGVCAELTLLYRHGTWSPLPWTYPDYAGPDLQAWLLRMRSLLLDGLRAARPAQIPI